MPKVALYAGSFDPITNGHTDLIKRSLQFVDRLIVAVAVNVQKQSLFTKEERESLIRSALDNDPRVDVRSFEGLLVEFALKLEVPVLIRGLRAVSDYEYEYQMALMNRHLAPTMETVFMVPSLDTTYISSSMVREVAKFGGDITNLVHPAVAKALRKKFGTGRGVRGVGVCCRWTCVGTSRSEARPPFLLPPLLTPHQTPAPRTRPS